MRRILHTIADVGPGSFGLGVVALHLAYQQSQLGCQTTFWSVSTADNIRWASTISGIPVDHFVSFASCGPNKLAYSPAMEQEAARSSSRRFDVIHQHSLWTGISRAAVLLRKHADILVIIAPHGTLTPWALQRSRLKKRFALAFYEGENLRNASCLHAVSETEAGEIRAFGLTNPVAVIPNAVADNWRSSIGDAERFRERFHLPADRRILLFLSRITPKKGLPMLLEALHRAAVAHPEWLLVIAGADEFGHEAQVKAQVAHLNLDQTVRFVGPLLGQDKRDALAAAEFFVLPSHSEGAPMVILEALAVGVPVLATQGSPWPELQTRDCGWWTPIDSHGIYEALTDAMRSSPDRLHNMGQRGRALIDEKYSWQRVAPDSLLVYDWLLNQAPKPDCVILD